MLSLRCLLQTLVVLALFVFSPFSTQAIAGFLVSPSASWTNFSFRPLDDEPTPNYYGYGGKLVFGYSHRQKLDLGLSVQYTPATLAAAKFLKGDATLTAYQLEIGTRISESVYIGLHGGKIYYSLRKEQEENEVPGSYKGNTAGFELGAMFRIDKARFWQISVDIAYVDMEGGEDKLNPKKRILDIFCLRLAYVYNHYQNSSIEGSAIGKFMDSMLFSW